MNLYGNFGEKFPSNSTGIFLAPKTGTGLSSTIYKIPVNFSRSLDMKPDTGNPNKWWRKFNFGRFGKNGKKVIPRKVLLFSGKFSCKKWNTSLAFKDQLILIFQTDNISGSSF